MKPLRWFDDSPQMDEPGCLCSWCENRIEEELDDEADDYNGGVCVRMWSADGKRELRFHDQCLREVTELGLLTLK